MRGRSPWIAGVVVGVTALACDPFRASADEDPASVADAGAEGDASGASALCQGPHFLCDDFDRGLLGVPPTWTSALNLAGFAFSADDPKSGPRAVDVTGSEGAPAYLGKRAPGAVSAVTCDLELRLPDTLPTGSRIDLLKLELATPEDVPEDFTDVVFSASPTELAFNAHHSYSDADEGYVSAALGATPSDGAWHHVRVALSTTQVSVTVEGVGTQSRNLPVPASPVTVTDIRLGALSGVGGPWRASFDDIVCDVRP